MLVLAADLQQVEEVSGRGMNGDEVFVRFRGGRGVFSDFEVFGALVVWFSLCETW